MGNIYDAITKAISAHWNAHDKYPQKLVLSPEQRSTFRRIRTATAIRVTRFTTRT